MIALIPNIGWQEMFLLLVIGLLLYGRNLPDAGRSLGRVIAQLKRSFHDFKDQLDRDGQLGDVKKALQDTAREVKNVANVPRALSKPVDALRDLTHEAMTSTIDEPIDKPAGEPVTDEPIDGKPVNDASGDGEPVQDEPVKDEPVTGESVDEPARESIRDESVDDASHEQVVENPEADATSAGESANEPNSTNGTGADRDDTSTPSTGSASA